MNYEQMLSVARDVNTSDEWLFDVAQKIMPSATELIVAIAENPNASEDTIIELCLSVITSHEAMKNIFEIPNTTIDYRFELWQSKKVSAKAIGAIANRIDSESALDEIVGILKKNTYNWEIVSEWEAVRRVLINGKYRVYLCNNFPEIFTMEYPGVNTDISEWEKRDWQRWDELDEYYTNLKASMTPQEWEAFEDEMLHDSDDYDEWYDDLEESYSDEEE